MIHIMPSRTTALKTQSLPVFYFVLLLTITLLSLNSCSQEDDNFDINISADTEIVDMGRCVTIKARIKDNTPNERTVLLPFVNGKRWGSHEIANKEGEAAFIIPLPNPVNSVIQVIALPAETEHWMGLEADNPLLKTGTFMPENSIISNPVTINVKNREILKKNNGKSLYGIQFENWFTPGKSWFTSQGVPLTGIYDSTDPDVCRQQILWFMDIGVDFIISDWSNHMWGKTHWDERTGFADGILHTTQLFLEVLADMRDEGLDVPKVVLMPGLSNGPPTTMEGLNEQLNWIYQDYIRNPRFKGLWQLYDGKPLIIILDTGIMAVKDGTTESAFRIPFFKETLSSGNLFNEKSLDSLRQTYGDVDDSKFTVRWMSSQNQTTKHHEHGYWSWMDGSLKPTVTWHEREAEAITVTPSFFAEQGWTAPEAFGRRGGWTYLESFKEAIAYRPNVIMLHQWNEYTGQLIGHGRGPNQDIFTDTYSIEFSDDLEPISPTMPGYRGTNPYGFYYLNLTNALMDIYRGDADDASILAVHIADSSNNTIKMEWSVLGVSPESFTIYLDESPLAEKIRDKNYSFSTEKLSAGSHKITVKANGVKSYYPLSINKFDIKTEDPIPVIVEKVFLVNEKTKK